MNYTFKSWMMKPWTILDDIIIIGEKEFPLEDVIKVDSINMPKNPLQDGVFGITTSDGKWRPLSFPYKQREEGAEAIEYIRSHSRDELAKLQAELEKREFRMRCNVCGKVTCFTMQDLRTNQKLLKQAALSSGISVFSAIFGTRYDAYEQGKIANQVAGRVTNFTKCPSCNSTDIKILTDEEWETIKAEPAQETTKELSAADEILKFKNLLDSGVITQEEFDAKKKQLLGL